jgi:hypothetical protein
MIKIDYFVREFILDLNEKTYNEHTLTIDSKGEKGNPLPWGIEFVDNKSVEVEKSGDKLIIRLDYKGLKEKVNISLRNYAKERMLIQIIPNTEALIPKEYVFEIKNQVYKNNELDVDLISTVNDNPQPWRCSYFGNPLSYEFSQTEGEGSCRVHIKLTSELFTEFKSKIIFEQENSGKEVELSLFNDKDGIKKAD